MSALVACVLSGCAPLAGPADADPADVARSLIYATKTISIPYVVDGAAIEQLVRRPGITKRVVLVSGVDVTSYVINGPGHFAITPVPAKDFGIGPGGTHVVTHTSCWMEVDGSPDFARQVISRFREGLTLTGYETKAPHDVPMPGVLRGPHDPVNLVCVRGRRVALVEIFGPAVEDPWTKDLRGYVDVRVESDPIVTGSEGCS